jgi:hypothetical protein
MNYTGGIDDPESLVSGREGFHVIGHRDPLTQEEFFSGL